MQGYISGVGNLSSQQGGDIDTYINISVDLTGVTSSQTVNIKGKTYNQYILSDNNITVKTITSLSDVETIQISDLLHYKLFPLSSNNNDTGLYLSYDDTTLTAYVATNNIGMSVVDFYFSYIYNIIAAQSVTIEHYVDIVGGSSGAGTNNLPIVDVNVVNKSTVGLKTLSVPQSSASYTQYTTQGDNDSVIISGRATPTSGDYFPRFVYNGGSLSTVNYSNLTVQFGTLRYNYIRILGVTSSSASTMTLSGTYELYNGDTLVSTHNVNISVSPATYVTIIDAKDIEDVEFDKCVIKIKSTTTDSIKLTVYVSLQYTCNTVDIDTNCLQLVRLLSNDTNFVYSINNKPATIDYARYNKLLLLMTKENHQTVHYNVVHEM